MEMSSLQTSSLLTKQLFVADQTVGKGPHLVRHLLTGVGAEYRNHKLLLCNKARDISIYYWRMNSIDRIIHIYHVDYKDIEDNHVNTTILCEKSQYSIQYILPLLEIQDLLYLFESIVKSSKVLSNKMGFFQLNREMLVINRNGECRIWVNSNHLQNEVEHRLQNQQQTMHSIIRLFNQWQVKNILFVEYISKIMINNVKFQNFITFHQQFIQENNIPKTKRISNHKLIKQSIPENKQISTDIRTTESIDFSLREDLFVDEPNLKLLSPKYVLKIPKNRPKNNKENILQSQLKGCSLKTNAKKPSRFRRQFSESNSRIIYNQPKPTAILDLDSKFQTDKKRSLDKLDGKLCQSFTAQQYILQQFKQIYL